MCSRFLLSTNTNNGQNKMKNKKMIGLNKFLEILRASPVKVIIPALYEDTVCVLFDNPFADEFTINRASVMGNICEEIEIWDLKGKAISMNTETSVYTIK